MDSTTTFISELSLVIALYSMLSIYILDHSTKLQVPYLKEGHYGLLSFGILDILHAIAMGTELQLLDNAVMCGIALVAVGVFTETGKRHRLKILIVAHLMVPLWLGAYFWVTDFSDNFAKGNLAILLSSISCVGYGVYKRRFYAS